MSIPVLEHTRVLEVTGDTHAPAPCVAGPERKNAKLLEAAGFVVKVGVVPNSEVWSPPAARSAHDADGYVVADRRLATSRSRRHGATGDITRPKPPGIPVAIVPERAGDPPPIALWPCTRPSEAIHRPRPGPAPGENPETPIASPGRGIEAFSPGDGWLLSPVARRLPPRPARHAARGAPRRSGAPSAVGARRCPSARWASSGACSGVPRAVARDRGAAGRLGGRGSGARRAFRDAGAQWNTPLDRCRARRAAARRQWRSSLPVAGARQASVPLRRLLACVAVYAEHGRAGAPIIKDRRAAVGRLRARQGDREPACAAARRDQAGSARCASRRPLTDQVRDSPRRTVSSPCFSSSCCSPSRATGSPAPRAMLGGALDPRRSLALGATRVAGGSGLSSAASPGSTIPAFSSIVVSCSVLSGLLRCPGMPPDQSETGALAGAGAGAVVVSLGVIAVFGRATGGRPAARWALTMRPLANSRAGNAGIAAPERPAGRN